MPLMPKPVARVPKRRERRVRGREWERGIFLGGKGEGGLAVGGKGMVFKCTLKGEVLLGVGYFQSHKLVG